MRTTGEIKNEVLVALGVSTTVAYYTDDILNDWIDKAHKWAAGFRKWPFTEGRVSTTATSSEEYVFPEGWKSDSIRLLQVGGKRFEKLNFNDYQIYREEEPNDDDKVFSDFGQLYYINPNAGLSGTITAYGQFTPGDLDGTDPDTKTVFSNQEEEGNDAIVERVLSYAAKREKKLDVARDHLENAKEILISIWQNYKDESFGYQTKNRKMFSDFDVLYGQASDELNDENRFF